jgi:hypothetical protein
MKRNLTLLTILGALIAMAVPASSTAAGVFPAGHNFEISGATMPTVTGSWPGSCTLTKITGSIPAAPKNEGPVTLPLALPTATCGTGVSIAFAGSWSIPTAPRYSAPLAIPASGVTLRYSSLPGCKLVNLVAIKVPGVWSNGATAPIFSRSGFHADGDITGTYVSDGSACAIEGVTAPISFRTNATFPATAPITDTTNGAEVVQLISNP